MHIPKTGGTTLRKIIDKQYSESETWHAYDDLPLKETVDQLSKKQLEKIEYIVAHFPFGVHRYFSRPCTYITMLRNPIDRVVSEYYRARRNPNIPIYDEVQSMGLKEFVSNDDFALSNSNRQTLLVCGRKKGTPYDLELDDLAKAKERLDKYFAVVGITEMFDESVYLMKKELGWDDIFYTKKNVARNRPNNESLSQKVVDTIKERNRLDLELYSYAKEKLKKQVKALNDRDKRKLNNFICQNKKLN